MRFSLIIFLHLLFISFCFGQQPDKKVEETVEEDKSILLQVVGYELEGKWQGKLYQEDFKEILSEEYDFELHIEVKGTQITGNSFIGVGNNYAKISFSGVLNGLDVDLREIEIEDSSIKENYLWCIKKMQLEFDFEAGRYVLKGKWSGITGEGSICRPGRIKVYKKTIRA